MSPAQVQKCHLRRDLCAFKMIRGIDSGSRIFYMVNRHQYVEGSGAVVDYYGVDIDVVPIGMENVPQFTDSVVAPAES